MYFSQAHCHIMVCFALIISPIFLWGMHVDQRGIDRIESAEFCWGRRIVAASMVGLGLYTSVDFARRGNIKKALAGAAVFGLGFFSFTAYELGVATSVYRKNNSQEEDYNTSRFACAHKDKEVSVALEKFYAQSESPVLCKVKKGSKRIEQKYCVQIPIEFLEKVYQTDLGTVKNEAYRDQQKPLLARLPYIGGFIDGMLYDAKSIQWALAAVGVDLVSPIALYLWLCRGIKIENVRSHKERMQSVPNDLYCMTKSVKELQLIKTIWLEHHERCEALIERYTIYMSNKKHKKVPRELPKIKKKNGQDTLLWPYGASYIGWLPIEIVQKIGNYVCADIFNKEIYVKKDFAFMDFNYAIAHLLPYIGPWIRYEATSRGMAICVDNKQNNRDRKRYLFLEKFISHALCVLTDGKYLYIPCGMLDECNNSNCKI
jgi:hypothetical protein